MIKKMAATAKTKVDIDVDFEKRKTQATKEIDAVLKKYEIGLRIMWGVPNGPYLALLDAKQYEEKPSKSK